MLSDILSYYGDPIPTHGAQLAARPRQADSVAAGTATQGEPAVEMERFVACCKALGIASPAVARLVFLQVRSS